MIRFVIAGCATLLLFIEPPSAASQVLAPQANKEPRFWSKDVSPIDRKVALPDDGRWAAVPDPIRADAEPILFATRLHPDAKRSAAEVFLVAMEVSQIRLYAVAGTLEPEATTSVGRQYVRSGLIPPEHQLGLLAAFNGGFSTKHGEQGMHVAGVTLSPPQAGSCTLLGLDDGSLKIGTWRALAAQVEPAELETHLVFWRQLAPCMYEGDQLNIALRNRKLSDFGAAIDGELAIRRSAIGLDARRGVLYVGIGHDTTPRAIAAAMHHAGASDVAQLDVGWRQPKFLLFPFGPDGRRRALGLVEGFVFGPDDYVIRPSTGDFLYLVRREPARHR